jgi:hypothetical protein
MTITITIPDAVADRVINALCTSFGYTGGPLTPGQFAKQVVLNFVKEQVRDAESRFAAAAARQAAINAVNADVTLT